VNVRGCDVGEQTAGDAEAEPRLIAGVASRHPRARRAAGVSRAISVDWLGQKAPRALDRDEENVARLRTSGSSLIPTACRQAGAERQAPSGRSMVPEGGPRRSRQGTTYQAGCRSEAADVCR
jgi:hypothetical protein